MQILLAAATQFEIAPFVAANPGVDVLITGVGCPSTMYSLLKRIHQFDYDVVIQAGIAGAFAAGLNLADVVMVSEDRFSDIGIAENSSFYSVFEKGLADPDAFPFSNGSLKNSQNLLNNFDFQKVIGITVNSVTDDFGFNKIISSKYQADIESMEGAALHYVCLQEEIPFLQLRAISNVVGERDKLKWNIEGSIGNLHAALTQIIGMINTGNIITPKQPR